jgi:hypothetical protein
MTFGDDLHDGFLDGVVTADTRARVFVRTSLGERSTLVLHGVDALLLREFRRGNVILECKSVDVTRLTAESVRELYQYSEERMAGSFLAEWHKKALQKKFECLEIVPSYGGLLLAVFRTMERIQGYVLDGETATM